MDNKRRCVLPDQCYSELLVIDEPGEQALVIETVETHNYEDDDDDHDHAYDSNQDNNYQKQSNIQCNLNEHYSECGSECEQSCQQSNSSSGKSCPYECKPGCYCNGGLLKNEYGVCVAVEQCICKLRPKICGNPNEEYFWCFHECGRTCFDFKKGSDANCADTCSRGCLCKIGYVRNEDGECVKEEECILTKSKIICKENEIFSDCGSDCWRGCDDLNKTRDEFQCFSCESGCFCQKGYYRSAQGLCITESECVMNMKIGNSVCDDNEEYTECGNFCIEKCDNKISGGREEHCPFTCQKGCICSEGFKRNSKGICVSLDKCNNDLKPSCDENEEYSECGSNCGNQCTDLANKNIQCPLICETGCFCKKGYLRNENRVCVAKTECEVPPMECSVQERYEKCGTHCGQSCDDLSKQVMCPEVCEEGCFCRGGHYRNFDGKCVPKSECVKDLDQQQITDCPSNEVFKECGNKCEESCDEGIGCKSECHSGCFCIEGYLRNKSGECVADNRCESHQQCVECEANEYYTNCGSDCGNLCTVLGSDVRCEEMCRKGCFCKYGFHRNDLGQCVRRDHC